MKRRVLQLGRIVAVLLTAALFLPAAAWQLESKAEAVAKGQGDAAAAAPAARDDKPLIAAGRSPGLFLIYTGDVIGYLDPCG